MRGPIRRLWHTMALLTLLLGFSACVSPPTLGQARYAWQRGASQQSLRLVEQELLRFYDANAVSRDATRQHLRALTPQNHTEAALQLGALSGPDSATTLLNEATPRPARGGHHDLLEADLASGDLSRIWPALHTISGLGLRHLGPRLIDIVYDPTPFVLGPHPPIHLEGPALHLFVKEAAFQSLRALP